jgi:hypothetical protein
VAIPRINKLRVINTLNSSTPAASTSISFIIICLQTTFNFVQQLLQRRVLRQANPDEYTDLTSNCRAFGLRPSKIGDEGENHQTKETVSYDSKRETKHSSTVMLPNRGQALRLCQNVELQRRS